VLELMNSNNWLLGGENSGHIICLDKHTSGDGIIAALQVLEAMRESAMTLPELLADITLYPQVLVNVKIEKRMDLDGNAAIQASVRAAEDALAGSGRVLLRPSGTEPKVRVMVEGQQREQVETLANRIADVVRAAS
jgi:Phosphomannomutase